MNKERVVVPPEGTVCYSAKYETFGVSRIRCGPIHYNDYKFGTRIVFYPGLVRVYVIREELSANDLNLIGEKTLSLFACDTQRNALRKLVPQSRKLVREIGFISKHAVGYGSSELANLNTEEVVDELGALLSKMVDSQELLDNQFLSLAKELFEAGVVFICSKADEAGFPIDKIATRP